MSDHSPEDRITHIDGVSRFCDTCDHEVWPCPTRILTDLIAELRDIYEDMGGGTQQLTSE